MSDEETHSDSGLDPILTGFGVLAVVAGLTVTAVLMAGRPKYDRTDLRTIEDLKAAQVASAEADPAWVDKEKGIASIPVSNAARIVVAEIQRDPSLATQGEPLPAATDDGAAGGGAGGATGAAGETSAAGATGEAGAESLGAGGAASAEGDEPAAESASRDSTAAPASLEKKAVSSTKPAKSPASAKSSVAGKSPASKPLPKAPAAPKAVTPKAAKPAAPAPKR